MPSAAFEPANQASKQPQTHILNYAANGKKTASQIKGLRPAFKLKEIYLWKIEVMRVENVVAN